MYEIRQTERFSKWLSKLKDHRAKAKIIIRLQRAALGNFGDHEPVGEGVSEFRISEGKGYRVYFTIKDKEIIFLLCGGNKSTQDNDIKLAKKTRLEL
jgi:putative addiction module killer protein